MTDGANKHNDKAETGVARAVAPAWLVPATRLILVVAVVISALAVAYLAQRNRQLFADVEGLRREEAALEARWSRLLLERSTLAAPSRIAGEAARLGMRKPLPAEIVVVQ